MSKKKPYALVNVKNVDAAALSVEYAGQDLTVGIDIAKDTLKVGPWWSGGRFSQPWLVRYPEQLPLLIERLVRLSGGRKLIVVLEPTGTYGDPLRWALKCAGLSMHRVQSKASRDYCEVFDGVPSNHDAKDALMLGKLGHQGDSRPWPLEERDELTARRRVWVAAADDLQHVLGVWSNRLEALLARHWPEATRLLDVHSVTLLKALCEYGSPAAVAADGQAAGKLQLWGGRFLDAQKVTALLESAKQTAGVPMGVVEREQLQGCAGEVLRAVRELTATRHKLARSTKGDALLELMGSVVGAATACVLFVLLGDPRKYGSARAYLKAAGLNLAERSSGRYQGQLKISKRGPSLVRKWLYLAACRMVKDGTGAAWLARRKAREGEGKGAGARALVALMRKLQVALWSMARTGEVFDKQRMFGDVPRTALRRRAAAAGVG